MINLPLIIPPLYCLPASFFNIKKLCAIEQVDTMFMRYPGSWKLSGLKGYIFWKRAREKNECQRVYISKGAIMVMRLQTGRDSHAYPERYLGREKSID